MEIFVSELPKCCEQCQINCSKKLKAKFSCLVTDCDGCIGSKSKNCPLKLLSTRLAEERKKVVQILKDKIEKRNNGTRNGNYSEQYKDGYSACCCDLTEILDQIERGE